MFVALVCNGKTVRKLQRTAGVMIFRASLRTSNTSASKERERKITTKTIVSPEEMELLNKASSVKHQLTRKES